MNSNNYWHKLLWVCIGIMIGIQGCKYQSEPARSTESHVFTQTPTLQYTFVPEITDTPSTTLPDRQEPLSPTDIPKTTFTLTPREKEMFVQNFLQKREECLLPCIGGVIPGKTTWNEVENLLKSEGADPGVSVVLDNGEILHGPGGFDIGHKHVSNSFSFVESEGVVSRIHLKSIGYNNPEYFQMLWEAYSPLNILSMYGIPSRVWLKTSPKTIGDRHIYDLWFVFDEFGFIILYSGFLEQNGQILHICPRFENGMDIMSLVIHSRSLDEVASLEYMGGLETPESQSGKKSIEVATGMTVEDFYNLFIQEQKSACIDTTVEIWE